jgi:5'-3' exonuclease
MQEHKSLVIDVSNMFYLAWAAYPSMSTITGAQTGGIVGSLKIISKLARELQPTRVYAVWESGGSVKRKSIYNEYKQKRKPEKLNRFYEDDIPETDNNRMHQMFVLLECLKCVPVCQVYVADCEADDVIAHLVRCPLVTHEKVIASSDKDFYQLLDDRTKQYSFHKKAIVTKADVLETFRVSSNNFALAKALCGDVSDNVPGIKGVGFKTVANKLSFLGTEEDIILQDVLDYCNSHVNEGPFYKKVIDNWDIVTRNWRLVNIGNGTLSNDQINKVDQILGTFEPKLNKMLLVKHLVREGVSEFDIDGFCKSFSTVGLDR